MKFQHITKKIQVALIKIFATVMTNLTWNASNMGVTASFVNAIAQRTQNPGPVWAPRGYLASPSSIVKALTTCVAATVHIALAAIIRSASKISQ